MELAASSKGPASLVGDNHLAELLALARTTPPGCFLEVGVYKGGSAWHLQQLASAQGRALYLFDTFSGIPHESPIDPHHIGDFADVDEAAVRAALPDAIITRGVFPESAIALPPIAFAHLDCDQYRSVLESALHLSLLMVSGGVMWFDDSPCLPGARAAAEELFGARLQLSSDFGKHYVIF